MTCMQLSFDNISYDNQPHFSLIHLLFFNFVFLYTNNRFRITVLLCGGGNHQTTLVMEIGDRTTLSYFIAIIWCNL